MTDVTPLDRVSAALAALSDAELDDAIRALGEGEHFAALAQALNTKRPALLAHPNPSEVVRPRSFSGTPGRRVLSAMALCGPCADDCIDNLGDAADDRWTVAKMVKDERAYHVFEELNTYTAVVYLQKVTHPSASAPAKA